MEGSPDSSDLPKPIRPSLGSEKQRASFMEDMMEAFASLLQKFADSQMKDFAGYMAHLDAGAEVFDGPVRGHSSSGRPTGREGHKCDRDGKGSRNEGRQWNARADNPSDEVNKAPKETCLGATIHSHDSYKKPWDDDQHLSVPTVEW